MSYFMQNGDAFHPTAGKDSLLGELPVGNYVVAHNPMTGMFFQRTDNFTHPGKIYGNLDDRADRIIKTFLDRPRATGVLLAGEKGSGKSLLARWVSYKAYEEGIATILVNHPWAGDEFGNLLASIEQPAVVLMDEFEKVYNKTELQEAVLTLLDGTMTTKKLFLLTVNDVWKVDQHMRNRPGRLFYALDFDGLQGDFIEEYCKDNLDEKDHTEAVVRISNLFEQFNFDMLKGLVEEMNRYKEDPFDALAMLNIKPVSSSTSIQYTLKIWDADGNEMAPHAETYEGTPLTIAEMEIYFLAPEEPDEDEDDGDVAKLLNRRRGADYINVVVRMSDVTKIDGSQGIFEFKTDDYTFLFTKKPSTPTNLRKLAF